MCLRFVSLLITRVAAGLRLSRHEEMWKTAEILILHHQLTVLQRRQPRRPKLNWADPARYLARRNTESAAPRMQTRSSCRIGCSWRFVTQRQTPLG
jgi:hypothetical protein